MTLTGYQTDRFYRVWWPLLSYVNAHVRVVRDLPPKPPEGSVDPADASRVRDALWKDDSLRERFITENPAGLSQEDLALIASWSLRIAGRFYIYRHLKKHTVVLAADEKGGAYGMLGLASPISELVRQPLPALVQMVLLPFEGRITYDSLIAPYRITFGPGIRSGLDDDYRSVRERGGVVTSLSPGGVTCREESSRDLQAGNALVLKGFRRDLAAAGLSAGKIDEHMANAEALAEALLQHPHPRPLLDVRPEDLRALLALRGPRSRVSLKRLARFLERSGRVEWGSLQRVAELG